MAASENGSSGLSAIEAQTITNQATTNSPNSRVRSQSDIRLRVLPRLLLFGVGGSFSSETLGASGAASGSTVMASPGR